MRRWLWRLLGWYDVPATVNAEDVAMARRILIH